MADVSIWTNVFDAPISACSDARLRGGRGRAFRSQDSDRGQYGWDLGLSFSSLPQLAHALTQLQIPAYCYQLMARERTQPTRRIRPGEIRKLAIMAHGAHGQLRVAGNRQEAEALSADTIPRHRSALARIARLTRLHTVIYLMECDVAGDGGHLLNALSNDVWRGSYIVGFARTGYAHSGGQGRGSLQCNEPGMRDTGNLPARGGSGQDLSGAHAQWRNRYALPWADFRSPSAYVSFGGEIVSSPGRRSSNLWLSSP